MKYKKIILIFLAFFTITPLLDNLTDYAQNPADAYLQDSVEKARSAFLTLTAMKSILAIVEGSDIETGVQFGLLGQSADITLDLEAGDFAEPTFDLVHKAWNITLIAWIAIEIERMLLYASDFQWGNFFMCFGFLGLLFISVKKVRFGSISTSDIHKFSILCLIFGFSLKFLFPFTVLTSEKISTSLTQESLISSQVSLDAKVKELGGLGEIINSSSPALEKYQEVSSWFQSHDIAFWQEYSAQIVRHTMILAAIFLLDAILLPLASVFFIWGLLKRFFNWLLGFSESKFTRHVQ
tara:strand:- start:640 stop:1524 length:885 start_codon:yes stop_codon:yes gene_type:complete